MDKLNNRINLRITSVDSLNKIQELAEKNHIPKNKIINNAIELGLEHLENILDFKNNGGEHSNVSSANYLNKINFELLLKKMEFLEKQNQELINGIQNILISNIITEKISSSTYQMLQVSIGASPSFAKIPNEIQNKFDEFLPPKFALQKEKMIVKKNGGGEHTYDEEKKGDK